MADIALLAEPTYQQLLARLPYFVDWRPRLWTPVVRWLIGDPTRFGGKRVLEIGCRSGRMSSLFGLLGADVVGVDLPGVNLDSARREAEAAGVSDRVHFRNYSGDPASLPDEPFDFIISKSVLVMLPNLRPFVTALAPKLKPGGELLAAENLKGGWVMQLVRQAIHWRRGRELLDRIHGIDAGFLATLESVFEITERRDFYWLVAGLRARRRA